jgi:peptidoglycan hydrolase CwlO-like protein
LTNASVKPQLKRIEQKLQNILKDLDEIKSDIYNIDKRTYRIETTFTKTNWDLLNRQTEELIAVFKQGFPLKFKGGDTS